MKLRQSFLHILFLLLFFITTCDFPLCSHMTVMAIFNCKVDEFYQVSELRCVKCNDYCLKQHLHDSVYRQNCKHHCPKFFEEMVKSLWEGLQTNSTRVTIPPTNSTTSSVPTSTTKPPNNQYYWGFAIPLAIVFVVAVIVLVKKCLAWRRKKTDKSGDRDRIEEQIPLDDGYATAVSSSGTLKSTGQGQRVPTAATDRRSAPGVPDQSVFPDTSTVAGTNRTSGSTLGASAAEGRSNAEGSPGLNTRLLNSIDFYNHEGNGYLDQRVSVTESLVDVYNIDVENQLSEQDSLDSGVPNS